MGTKRTSDGELQTNGGRVLAVSALGKSATEAREKAYARLAQIHYDGMVYRSDIGKDLLDLTDVR